ncbi:hypothetical protein GRF59_06240 [Paenibacillus sp. HJL G12]|uniref:Photosynthesis system II assembly factor Ycf48/Hcf136-like domain-containing protein n=1 Tax=Paenibacillus dendrobii TaxID=2691084 RepID=A0A7X3IGV4_9BACL|nr:YCF48-related protein [Paenibacillus dendrobii]MWV43226.1 hypothetical protein [Paenibacillus dendrobii]
MKKIKHWSMYMVAVLAIMTLLLSACSYGKSNHIESSSGVQALQLNQKLVVEKVSGPSLKGDSTPINVQSVKQAELQEGSPVKIENTVSPFDIPVIDFVNDTTGFAVKQKYGESLTLISTTDGGEHWAEKKLPGQFVRSMDFVDGKTGWVLIEEGCTTSGTTTCKTMRLLKTSNAGNSWITKWQAASKEDRSHVFVNLHRLSFQDSNSGVMLVNGALYVTRDGGSHFKAVSFGVHNFTPLYMSFLKGQIGYVAGSVGRDAGNLAVLKTMNGGGSWQKQLQVQAKDSPLSSLGIQFINESTGWLLTNDTGIISGDLYRTTDGGKHWNKVSIQRTGRPTPTSFQFTNTSIGMMSLHPGAGPVEGGIYKTTDGGKTFTSVAPGHLYAVNQLQMISSKQIWAAADDISGSGFIVHSSDGGSTWQQLYPSPYPEAQPTEDMSFLDSANGFAIGTQLDSNQVLQTKNGGSSWNIVSSINGYIRLENISFISKKEGYVIAYREAAPHHVLLNTADGGQSWSVVSPKALEGLDGISELFFFRFYDERNGLLFASGHEKIVWRTTDGGRSWNKTQAGQGTGLLAKAFFTTMSDGWILREGDQDNPATLSRVTDGKGEHKVLTLPAKGYPEAISFTDSEHGYIMMEDFKQTNGISMHLLTTTDGGKRWIDHPFPKGTDVGDIEHLTFADRQHGWLQFYQGIAETKDGGLSWTVLQ